MNEIPLRFLKRLGIRSLQFFGVACTFVGYVIVVSCLFFSGIEESGIGWGLIGLGIPHVLAAAVLQKGVELADPEFGRAMRPSLRRLLATSLILPGLFLGAIVFLERDGRRPSPYYTLYIATSLTWIAGLGIVFFRFFWRVTGPGAARLLATSLIFPFALLIGILFSGSGELRERPAIHGVLTICLVWIAFVAIAFVQHMRDLTPVEELSPWDRTYIRWGWLVFLAIELPIAMLILR